MSKKQKEVKNLTSLRVSGTLLLGVVVIYQKKMQYFIGTLLCLVVAFSLFALLTSCYAYNVQSRVQT